MSNISKTTTTKIIHGDDNDADDPHLYDCLVVGGGISGSTLAHNLHRNHGIDVLLCESSNRLGGNVRSTTVVLREDDGEERGDDDGTTRSSSSFLYEEGPNNFEMSSNIMRISEELNLSNDLVYASDERSISTWIYHDDGRVHPLPAGGKILGRGGMLDFFVRDDLLSWRGKLRAWTGMFLGHSPPPPRHVTGEETIMDWSIRTLGTEAYRNVIEPIVSGIYVGDPSRLSASTTLPRLTRMEGKAYELGWNVFGALFYGGLALRRDGGGSKDDSKTTSTTTGVEERRNDGAADLHRHPKTREFERYRGRPGSFRTGLIALPNAIMDELGSERRVRLSWRLTNVERRDDDDDDGGGYYVATFDNDGLHRQVRARSVVVTIPAHAIGKSLDVVLPGSADLFASEKRDDANHLGSGVPYPPVASVTVAYPKSSFRDFDLADGSGNVRDLPGYGMVATRSAGLRTLATLFASSIFPGRCPANYNLLSCTVGGTRNVAIGTMSENDIVAIVDEDLRAMLLRQEAPPPKVLGVKLWPRAIPQYELGHSDTMMELKRMEDANSAGGMWVCGNYRTGVSLTACVNFGYDHAKVVAEHLSSERGRR
jgi:oxygen-dependent protoporphyrinogen oxidase